MSVPKYSPMMHIKPNVSPTARAVIDLGAKARATGEITPETIRLIARDAGVSPSRARDILVRFKVLEAA